MLIKGEEMPIDVYDAASWMVITVLSEESIALGGHPVTIPDFTAEMVNPGKKGRYLENEFQILLTLQFTSKL